LKVLQINASVNSGSTGHIAEDIGRFLIGRNHESIIAYGRNENQSISGLIRIGNKADQFFHLVRTRFFDQHGFGSANVTHYFIDQVKELEPDIIHLHNIHGYYLHAGVLFDYLKSASKPIIWTLHDCWSFTGHCSHYQYYNCTKWKTQCNHCPAKNGYPASWLLDKSSVNYIKKKKLFNSIPELCIISPSSWLRHQLSESFLSDYPVRVINNGIDTDVFIPMMNENIQKKMGLNGKRILLGVATNWSQRKGLFDFIKLRKELPDSISIILVGLKKSQMSHLPEGIMGLGRTESMEVLAELYSLADAFVNPTYVDNFPNVNIEALSCGTPVITYNTGGSPEAINHLTGISVDKGDLDQLKNAIMEVLNSTTKYQTFQCRERALALFSARDRYHEYLNLYEEILSQKTAHV
jgi:glycosyltransferase involved in cell wall biosynthesis